MRHLELGLYIALGIVLTAPILAAPVMRAEPAPRLVGINCAVGPDVQTAINEDEFPAPCAEVLPLADYCFTDSGVEDAICEGVR